MKNLINSCKIAFAMYSKIPVPKCDWTKENMRYAMCFFPWVGAVIGMLSYGWYLFSGFMGFSQLFQIAGLLLLPVLITGGIHLDGLLDTADALSSWQEQERRLEILKDSNSGAFAIITCVCYFILYGGVYSMASRDSMLILAFSFIFSRSLSGYSIVSFKMARNTGLAHTFSDGAQKKNVGICMLIYMVVLSFVMSYINILLGPICVVTGLTVFSYYKLMSEKYFGGITGDLAGWFLQISELAMACMVILVDTVLRSQIWSLL